MTDRCGLVLAGGGARGAYQVGVVEYLAEAGIPVVAIAGASVGALNGAVLASAPTLADGAARLAAAWEYIAEIADAAPLASAGAAGGDPLSDIAAILARIDSPILRPAFLSGLLRSYGDPGNLRLPLWVSLFPAVSLPEPVLASWGWLVDTVRGSLGAPAEWKHVNALDPADAHDAILASAALPIVMPARAVGGVRYRDGGLADNVPAGALLQNVECDYLVVTHLNPGVLWDAHRFAPGRILEIRPTEMLHGGGFISAARALLDFSTTRIRELRRLGYADAKRVIGTARQVIGSANAVRTSEKIMLDAIAALDAPIVPDSGVMGGPMIENPAS